MKKLMTSTIIILPLIILAIMLVSGAIMSLVTHIYVERVEFSNNEAIVLVMNDEQNPPTHNLKADINVFPLEAPNRDIVYTDYDENLLQISDDGVITPLFYGETSVTVQSKENKAATATRKVIITDDSVHSLEINSYTEDLYEGESEQLTVSIYPQEAENKAVLWSSSDEEVLQVASNGVITALGNGTVTVTATSVDNPDAKTTATVKCHAKLKEIIFDNSLLQTSLATTQFPEVTTNPEKCDVTWEYVCDNTNIATVDQTGKITFSQPGKVTVTVKGTDFKGNSVEEKKVFVSTMGYFVGPLFNTKEVKFADCEVGAALPLNFTPKLEGTYRLIGKIEYDYDKEVTQNAGQTGLIVYDENNMNFNLTEAFPEFNNYVNVVVHATVYDSQTDALNSTYEDYFYITKTDMQNSSKVYRDGDELSSETPNEIIFGDIGESIVLTIENPDSMRVQIQSNQYVDAVRDGNTITLKSKNVCDNVEMELYIGAKKYVLKETVHAKAQWIKVNCGDTSLSSGGDGATLLDSLTFEVQKGRDDGQNVFSQIKYQIGTGEQTTIVGGTVTIQFTEPSTELKFVCDDIIFTYTVVLKTLEDFGISANYQKAGGDTVQFDSVASVKAQSNIQYTLPKTAQSSVTLQLNIADFNQYLGGLGTNKDFEEIFKVTLPEGVGDNVRVEWTPSVNGVPQIAITFTQPDFNQSLVLVYGDGRDKIQVDLQIIKVNIQKIAFVKGTDSFDSTNYNDVYKGYQQVRVFAKHSYYEGKQVDYFRMPLQALNKLIGTNQPVNPEDIVTVENMINGISWNLSRYKDKSLDKELTTQKGNEVTVKDGSGDKNYTITLDGDEYVLKDESGATVSGHEGKNDNGIIWIDTFSEIKNGYVRIYFGNFGGLSEVDVQNDYFGDFGEQGENWKKVNEPADVTAYEAKEGSGRKFGASKNAYSFLRIEANDGAEGGVNCHFNFNVLDDPEGSSLVNVFDAKGYCNYKYGNIVLHNNLYADGELSSDLAAKNADLILKPTVSGCNDTQVTKNLIYGNGYQVNLKVLSDMVRDSDLNGGVENTGHSTTFGTVYNVTLKGNNPPTEEKPLNPFNYRMLFVLSGAYYSDLQSYSKMNTVSAKVFFKNTVLRYVANAAVQLFQGSNPYNLYFENIVAVECMRVVSLETTQISNFNLKGFFDILDYNNAADLQNKYNSINNGWLYAGSFTESAIKKAAPNHIEWFGSNGNDYSKSNYKYYVNIGVIQQGSDDIFKERHWDKKENKYSEAVTSEQVRFSNIQLMSGLATAHIPNALNSADGGASDYKSRNTDLLFTDTRDIRLLCQFRTINDTKLEKNTEHIQWHMNKVYRDMDLAFPDGREDHIAALKESLKNVTWPDGTGTDGEGNVKSVAAAMNSLLSRAIVPGKREYAVV